MQRFTLRNLLLRLVRLINRRRTPARDPRIEPHLLDVQSASERLGALREAAQRASQRDIEEVGRLTYDDVAAHATAVLDRLGAEARREGHAGTTPVTEDDDWLHLKTIMQTASAERISDLPPSEAKHWTARLAAYKVMEREATGGGPG